MSKWAVRKAEEKDRAWVVEQAAAFLRYIDVGVPVDYDHLEKLFDTFSGANFYLLVVTCDDQLRGVAAAMLQDHFFNPAVKMFSEVMWWVPEEFRNSRAGAILLDAMDKIGSATADLVVLAIEHNSKVNVRSLNKRGFEMKEMSLLKRVAQCQP